MSDDCAHLPDDLAAPVINAEGCEDCLEMGRHDWVHLRFCQGCGRVGCCDNSPMRHATAHAGTTGHPLIRSFEPGEDWWWCFVDGDINPVAGSPGAPSHS